MKKALLVALMLVAVLAAQTATNGQMTLKPLGASTGCISDATGAVLCAATDGFYISIAGGPFAKIQTASTNFTQLTCTTASLSAGASGTLAASGCTFK
jgi:hypothetical protein